MMKTNSKWFIVIVSSKSQTNPIKQTYEITSLLFTLVKLNLSGLKGWDTLFITWGCLRLLNLISLCYVSEKKNYNYFKNLNKTHIPFTIFFLFFFT